MAIEEQRGYVLSMKILFKIRRNDIIVQENRQSWREENGGEGGEEVSFVVNVHEPFDIYPGMECRAMVISICTLKSKQRHDVI